MSQYIDSREVIRRKQRSFFYRMKWEKIIFLAFFVSLIFVFAIVFIQKNTSHDIEYVEYVMQENDSLFNVVQELNTYAPFGWDARDFVHLAIEHNNISSVKDIKQGQTVYIPVARPKE